MQLFGFGTSEAKLARWYRRERVSRALFHRFVDEKFPGETRLWKNLTAQEKLEWLDRAEKHVRAEERMGKELPYA